VPRKGDSGLGHNEFIEKAPARVLTTWTRRRRSPVIFQSVSYRVFGGNLPVVTTVRVLQRLAGNCGTKGI